MQKDSSIFTLKSVVIGIVLIPINYYWIIQMEVLRWSFPTYIVPFYNAIFSLLVLISLNFVFRKFLRRTFLNQGELITIYVMLSTASALASINMMQVLVPTIGHAFEFATPENEWKELFWKYLPNWLTIDNKNVLQGYYNGDSSLFQIDIIKVWLFPIIAWSCFIIALILVMLCINIILKEQWSDREKLAYPIAQLPLEMTNETLFFKNKLMWIGFAIAGGIDIINGLSFIFPSIPLINLKTSDIGHFFPNKPWNAMGWSMISFYPFAIGLGFLMPLSLAVSCWVFYILYKAELIISSALGLQMLPGFPYPNQQAFGAYIGIFLFAIWIGRKYFWCVIIDVFGKANKTTTNYRMAIWGIIGGVIFLIVFSIKAGMTPWIAIAFFVIYFALAIAITRMRAELGFPVHDMHNMAPDYQLVTIMGTRRLGPSVLTVFSLFHWFNRTYASHPMPHQLEGFQMAENAGFNFRKLSFAIIIATAFGALAFFFMLLQTYYRLGAASGKCGYWTLGFGIETFNRLQWWMSYPTQTDYPSIIFMVIGFAFALFLMIMRMRFFWWTFHPLGYAVANSWGMLHIWFPLFLSSMAKWLILKFGGIKAYRRVTMFFLGLILGEFTIGGFWNIVSIIFNIPTYQFWI